MGRKINRPDESMLLFGEDEETLKELDDAKSKYQKIVQAAIGQWVRDFKRGDIRVSTVEDLRTLIELDLRLQRRRM